MSSNYEIRERLKKYKEFQQEMCDECGYEGTFGVTKPRVSALFRVPVSAALLFGAGVLWQYVLGENPVAWFFLFPPIVAFYIYFLNRKDIVCPNCGAHRRRTETFVVAYDANKYDRIEYGGLPLNVAVLSCGTSVFDTARTERALCWMTR